MDQTGAQIDVAFGDQDFHVVSASALMVAVAPKAGIGPAQAEDRRPSPRQFLHDRQSQAGVKPRATV